MYQKIKAKFKANPTIFYACSIVASWAGVGSLMNFRTLAINNGAAAAVYKHYPEPGCAVRSRCYH